MAKIKYTKQELRNQQIHLEQLERYLPTLQLRKNLLQSETIRAQNQLKNLRDDTHAAYDLLAQSAPLLDQFPNAENAIQIGELVQSHENIAGVTLPVFESVAFEPYEYDLYDTPPWLDALVSELRAFKSLESQVITAERRIEILERELRDVFIKVNLFEKVLIPQCIKNIRSIKIFLGDLDLSAVAQAKKAKDKILKRKVEVA